MLYEAICSRDTPTGRICLHVPVLRIAGAWYNANTGAREPWVKSAEPMVGDRLRMFEFVGAATAKKIETDLRSGP